MFCMVASHKRPYVFCIENSWGLTIQPSSTIGSFVSHWCSGENCPAK